MGGRLTAPRDRPRRLHLLCGHQDGAQVGVGMGGVWFSQRPPVFQGSLPLALLSHPHSTIVTGSHCAV